MRQPIRDGAFPVPRALGEAIVCSDGTVGGVAADSSAKAAPAWERTATMIQTVSPILIVSLQL